MRIGRALLTSMCLDIKFPFVILTPQTKPQNRSHSTQLMMKILNNAYFMKSPASQSWTPLSRVLIVLFLPMDRPAVVKGEAIILFTRYFGKFPCSIHSFTMQGPSTTDDEMKGVIPNSFSHIFQCVKSTPNIEFLIRCSYLELYNEEIRDLLANPKIEHKCELKEDPAKGVFVKGLTDVVVESPEDLYKMLDKGLSHRTVAATLMNSESSRSHSIFTIIVEMNTKDEVTGKVMCV